MSATSEPRRGQHPHDREPEPAAAADDERAPAGPRSPPISRLTPVRREVDAVPAGGAVGEHVRARRRSAPGRSCRWPAPAAVWSPALERRPSPPTAPSVSSVGGVPRSRRAASRRRRRRPRTASMPVCCAQATPPTRTGAGRHVVAATAARRCARTVLTGPCSHQPRSVQYAVKSANVRDLQVDHPLARRDVAVEPGHDHAHREAVLDRQRLAVHRDREHRVAVVGERRQRRAAGPAVVGGLQHGVGAGLHAGLVRAGRRAGRRSTRRCRSGRRRPGWRRS